MTLGEQGFLRVSEEKLPLAAVIVFGWWSCAGEPFLGHSEPEKPSDHSKPCRKPMPEKKLQHSPLCCCLVSQALNQSVSSPNCLTTAKEWHSIRALY